MKDHVTRLFSLRLTRLVSFSVFLVLSCLGLIWYANQHGGVRSPFADSASVTWLTRDNVKTELNLSQDTAGNIKAAPQTPVLIIECVPESCESEDLNLPTV